MIHTNVYLGIFPVSRRAFLEFQNESAHTRCDDILRRSLRIEIDLICRDESSCPYQFSALLAARNSCRMQAMTVFLVAALFGYRTEVKKIGTLENVISARMNDRVHLLIRCTKPLLCGRSLTLRYSGGLIRNNIGDNSFNLSRGRHWLSVGLSTMWNGWVALKEITRGSFWRTLFALSLSGLPANDGKI